MNIPVEPLKRLLVPLGMLALTYLNKRFNLNLSQEELMGTAAALVLWALSGGLGQKQAEKAVAAAEGKAEEARATVDTLHDAAQALKEATSELKETANSIQDVAKVQAQLLTDTLSLPAVK